MLTIELNEHRANLLMFAVVNTPLEGLRWSDFSKLDGIKGMLKFDKGAPAREVEFSDDIASLLKAAWRGAPAGRLPRFDELTEAVTYLEGILKE